MSQGQCYQCCLLQSCVNVQVAQEGHTEQRSAQNTGLDSIKKNPSQSLKVQSRVLTTQFQGWPKSVSLFHRIRKNDIHSILLYSSRTTLAGKRQGFAIKPHPQPKSRDYTNTSPWNVVSLPGWETLGNRILKTVSVKCFSQSLYVLGVGAATVGRLLILTKNTTVYFICLSL